MPSGHGGYAVRKECHGADHARQAPPGPGAAARGFYRSAPLLIMDEPTAALDARAEYALFSSVRQHAEGRSVLIITHRLASVRHAHRGYVLRDGRVTEQGTHADLMARGGQYAELYTLQASQYDNAQGNLSHRVIITRP
jgi:ATP-binding cassette, subfamily B, bacterial